MSGTVRTDKVITSGTFALDGGRWDVENNIWLIGDESPHLEEWIARGN